MSIYPRTNYEMSEEQLQRILDASWPASQRNADRAWEALGREMGFDWETVQPRPGLGPRFFSAIPSETQEQRKVREAKPMNLDTGGPAFPVSEEEARGKVASVYGGMTWLDYAAIHVAAGVLADSHVDPSAKPEEFCQWVYEIANALLAEKRRRESEP